MISSDIFYNIVNNLIVNNKIISLPAVQVESATKTSGFLDYQEIIQIKTYPSNI